MFQAITYIDARLRSGIDGAAAILMAAVTVLGISQVIARYVFNSSLIWSEELIRLLYVWLVLVAAATAPHMKITLLSDLATGWTALALKAVHTIVMLGILFLLVDGALRLNASFGNDRYVTLGIEKSWYWTGAIVGALLWVGTIVSDLAVSAFNRREP